MILPPDAPSPFPALSVDRRSPGQRNHDKPYVEKQVGFFGENAQQNTSYQDLIQALQTRRAGSSAVQFDLLTNAGAPHLVVKLEALVRLQDPDLDAEKVHLDAVFSDAGLQSAAIGCPELDQMLRRFVADPAKQPSNESIQIALGQLGLGGSAGRTGVAACQQGPGPLVVVKQEDGPAPTTVKDANAPAGEGTSTVVVAVIDTGIAQLMHGDGWLEKVERRVDNVDPLDAFPFHPYPLAPGNGYLDYAAGHGSFVAGLIQSVEPNANIRMYTALDSDGYGTEIAVGCAMIQAVKDGAQVINLSVGVRTGDATPPIAIQAALDWIKTYTTDAGITPPAIVAAAGNFGDELEVFPAACAGVTAVAALTADGKQAAWSSSGTWVAKTGPEGGFSTIGEGVVGPYVAGIREADFKAPAATPGAEFTVPAWAVWTGTSFAAPQIAGVVASICRSTPCSPSQAISQLAALSSIPDPKYGSMIQLLPGTPKS